MLKRIFYSILFLSFGSLGAWADGVGTTGPSQFPQQTGKELFANICQSCHMPDAKGATGAGTYPALSKNENLRSSMYLAYVIMYGRHGMPGFGGVLDDAQITELVNYVRSSFDNHYQDPVTEANISSIRKPDYEYVDMN
ncbi:c-type cytochrome [Bartonella sp. LJL80]